MKSSGVEEFCSQLRRRQIQGAMPCARRTAEILRVLITSQRHPDADSLIDDVRQTGYQLQAAKPSELAIGNMVRRVLHLIREEAENEQAERDGGVQRNTTFTSTSGLIAQALGAAHRAVSLSNLLDVGIADVEEFLEKAAIGDVGDGETESHATSSRRPGKKTQWKGKQAVIEAINELIDELENIQASITASAVEHIHANEVILTYGMSDTTFSFLKEAAKKREFQVIVAEGAPLYEGHAMASRLAEAGVQTTAISDCAIFAMMARANKVLVGANAVLANGGIQAPIGMHMVALAAKRHSIPFVVLVGLHKLSPLFPHDPDLAYNDFLSPSTVVDFDIVAESFAAQLARDSSSSSTQPLAGSQQQPLSVQQQQQQQRHLTGSATSSTVSVANASPAVVEVPSPAYDYIPPDLISLFVTDTGGYTPSYVYRLLQEYYSRQDFLLSKQLWCH